MLTLSDRMGDDGVVTTRVPAPANGMADDLLSLVVLGSLKRDHGVSVNQVRGVVLERDMP